MAMSLSSGAEAAEGTSGEDGFSCANSTNRRGDKTATAGTLDNKQTSSNLVVNAITPILAPPTPPAECDRYNGNEATKGSSTQKPRENRSSENAKVERRKAAAAAEGREEPKTATVQAKAEARMWEHEVMVEEKWRSLTSEGLLDQVRMSRPTDRPTYLLCALVGRLMG